MARPRKYQTEAERRQANRDKVKRCRESKRAAIMLALDNSNCYFDPNVVYAQDPASMPKQRPPRTVEIGPDGLPIVDGFD